MAAFSLGSLYQAGCCCGGGCGVIVCVSACPTGDPLPGATVTIDGFTPCTAGSGGCCLSDIGAAGTYPITVSATGYHTWSGKLAMTCGELIPIELRPVTDPPTVTIGAQGCCAVGAPFFTVTLSDGQSCTSDALGTPCNFWMANPGTYTYTITAPRFDPVSGSFAISSQCQSGTTTVTEGLTPSSGYICISFCPYPVPTTLFYSDSQYGAVTINFDGVSLYTGIAGASFPGGCGCPAAGSNHEVDMDAHCQFGLGTIESGLTKNPFTSCPNSTGTTLNSQAMTVVSVSATAPLVITGSAGMCSGSSIYPSGATFTVTE